MAPLSQVLALQLDDGSLPFSQKTPTAQPTFLALRLPESCGMTVEDELVSRAITYITTNHLGKGAVSYTSGASGILPCYLGLVARDVIRMGGRDSQLVQASIRWLLDYQRYDHRGSRRGVVKTWPHKAVVHYRCWESVSCYHGVVAALQAFAALPTSDRTQEVNDAIAHAVEYLRIHRAYRSSLTGRPLFRHMTQFFLVGDYR